ncbi:hypothetical protein KLL39_17985 [Clostridioides difficile]|nr:hypothetical protein [Clostridioides difficile]MDN9437280.1 hypothetical protein [Clostridioides difficile]HEM7410623.1 hypothetical protein [Clostridioides difficile]HEM7411179.1 hypothetical protein [Clostridioides difficile]
MILIVILSIFIIASINIIILGKENIRDIVIPLTLFIVSDFLFLCGNIICRGGVMLLFIGLFAIPLMLIAFIWICVHMIKLYYKKDLNKRKMIGCIFSIFISIGTIFIPSPSESFRFKLYEKDYSVVAKAILKVYDEKKLSSECVFYIQSDKNELEKIFSKEVIKKMKKLNRNLVYFFFGAELQSIDGIVIFKDLKHVKPKLDFINRSIQAPRLEYITNNVYYFKGEL